MSFFDAMGIANAAGNVLNKFLESVTETESVNTTLAPEVIKRRFGSIDKNTADDCIESEVGPEDFLSGDAVADENEAESELMEFKGFAQDDDEAELELVELDNLPEVANLDLPEFCHPNDRSSLEKMRSLPGFTRIMSLYTKHFTDREQRLELMSNSLRVSPYQCPEIHRMMSQACEFFGIEEPEIFVVNNLKPNIYASGAEKHQIVLTTKFLDITEPGDLEANIVRECSHIFCKHMLYLSFGRALTSGVMQAALKNLPVINGVSNLATKALSSAYSLWSRCAELSADRAEALYLGSAEPVAKRFLRSSAGTSRYTVDLSISDYRAQGEECLNELNESGMSRINHMFDLADSAQRLYPIRAAELFRWTESDEFGRTKAKYRKDAQFEAVA